jgi:hypothetical protein
VAALSGLFGSPDATGTGCTLAGPDANTVRWKELSVQFVNGQFNAYTVRPPSGTTASLSLTTREGIGLGSTVAALRAAYGDRVKIPGLPPQFGGMNFSVSFPGTMRTILGSLSATTDDGRITGFFTQTCE